MNNRWIIWSNFLVLNSDRLSIQNCDRWLPIQNINIVVCLYMMNRNMVAVLSSLYSNFRLLKMRLMGK